MNADKQKRLTDKGWKSADAEEFLKLSPEESAYIDLKVRLAESLKNKRAGRNLSQVQAARILKTSQSRMAKMEAGDPSVSVDLLIKSLLAFGATREDLGTIIG